MVKVKDFPPLTEEDIDAIKEHFDHKSFASHQTVLSLIVNLKCADKIKAILVMIDLLEDQISPILLAGVIQTETDQPQQPDLIWRLKRTFKDLESLLRRVDL